MPEKRYKKGCGPSCIKCWVNNLKHGNKEVKEYLKKHPELNNFEVKHAQPKKDKSKQSQINRTIDKCLEAKENRIKFGKLGNKEATRYYRNEEKEEYEKIKWEGESTISTDWRTHPEKLFVN